MYPIFDKTIKNLPQKFQTKHTLSSEEQYFSADEDENSSWVWYDPPEDSAAVKFCMDTSLHGLQYLGQRNRHMCERVFWFTAFSAAVAAAVALIWHMAQNYANMPIVTVFKPSEVTMDSIPFPSVTICNVNNIQRSKFEDLKKRAIEGLKGNLSESEFLKILATFLDIRHICQSARSFTERFVPMPEFGDGIDEEMMNRSDQLKPFLEPKETLRKFSQSCEEMILFCVWNDVKQNCSQLFGEVETDYGYCCTFNMIPLPLQFKNSGEFDSYLEQNSTVLEEWRQANLSTENLISDVNRTYPYRQLYPGRAAGLSILLEPDLGEAYCTNSDSEGFMIDINTPLDFPRIKDSGLAIRTDSEVFVGIKPEITMSDESTTQFPLEKRKCYYSTEFKLPTYSIYTTSNCLDECIAYRVREKCNCLRYYMPGYGNDNRTLCEPEQYVCTEGVREDVIRKGLASSCWTCLPSCSEIVYYTETTSLKINEKYTKRLFEHCNNSRAKNVSIVHVYFNVDSTYPRLRKEMSTVIDLISSAGGLLGLCMGFSMLSLLEIIYHSTIRLFWNNYRGQSKEQNKIQRRTLSSSKKRRTIGNLDYADDKDERHQKSYGFLGKVFQRSVPRKVKDHIRRNSDGGQIFLTNRAKLKADLPDCYQTDFETKFQGDFVDSLGQLKVDIKQN